MLQTQEAEKYLESNGMSMIYNKTLKLYMIFINESYVYLSPDQLKNIPLSEFKDHMMHIIAEYNSTDPYICYH